MFGLPKASGFTLIEVMIAVMVLSIGLLGVAAMQTRATQSNLFANQLSERTSVAERTMEWLMGLDFDDINLNDTTAVGTFTSYPNPPDTVAPYPDPPTGAVTWDVDADSPVNNVKTIRVTFTPADAKRQPVIFTFVRANRKGM